VSKLIGLDVGFGFIKVTNGVAGFSFPSIVGRGQMNFGFNSRIEEKKAVDDLKLIIDEKMYFVGKEALKHSNFVYRNTALNRSYGNDLRILFFAALSLFCTERKNNFKVVTGLPPSRMHIADRLIDTVMNSNMVKIIDNNKVKEIEINVKEMEVVPQPLGTYWTNILDSWGNIKNVERKDKNIGIVDVGFATTDLATIDSSEFVNEKSRTISIGLSDAYKEISQILSIKYELPEKANHTLDEAIINKKIMISGEIIDISNEIDEVFEKLASNICAEINSTWMVNNYDELILTGGGGQALNTLITSEFRNMKLTINPLTSNSLGYFSWANNLWKGKEEFDADII